MIIATAIIIFWWGYGACAIVTGKGTDGIDFKLAVASVILSCIYIAKFN